MLILGIEVHRHRDSTALAWLLGVTHPDVVIDVGANEGQFQTEVRTAGFRGRSIAVEPLPHLAAKLSEQGIETHAVAAGEADVTAQLTVYADSSLSSLHPMGDLVHDLWPDGEVHRVSEEIMVPVRRLDAMFGDIPGDLFLKIDTQGHDLAALRGAEGLLDHVVMIQTELAFQNLYETTDVIEEHLAALRAWGFGLAALTPISRTADVAIVEADGLFVRTSSHA